MIAKSTPAAALEAVRLEAQHVERGVVSYRIAARGEEWQAIAAWRKADARGTPADGAVTMWKGSRVASRAVAVAELGVRMLADFDETYAAAYATAVEARARAVLFEVSGRVPAVVARAREAAFKRAVGLGHALARRFLVYESQRRAVGLLPMTPLSWWLEEAMGDIRECPARAESPAS